MSRQPFLGETTDRNEAFPDIISLTLTIRQDPFGHYLRPDRNHPATYTKANLRRRVECANPRCQQGGLDLQPIIDFQPNGEHEFSCSGHEGSPGGRRKGQPCNNSFQITLNVERG